MRVQVSQDDIEYGWKADAVLCPVAIALCREIGAPVKVSCLHWQSLYYGVKALPEKVIDWIYDYDTGRDVQPMTFEVEL